MPRSATSAISCSPISCRSGCGGDASDLVAIHARDAAAILSPLLLAMAGERSGDAAGERRAGLFARGWLLLAFVSFLGFGGWYNHYTLPVMVPGSIVLASFLRPRGRPVTRAAIALGLLGIAGQTILLAERGRRGDADQFDALAAQVGKGSGGLFIYSGPMLLYPATGRPAPTRFAFPSHLEFVREAGAIGVDQADEIRRIFARAPEVVVMSPPIGEERPAIRALVLRLLDERGYRAMPLLGLGNNPITVFRRRLTTPPSPPAAR